MPQKSVVTRRGVMAGGTALGLAAPFVRSANAAGSLTIGLWDHWVPGANEVQSAIIKEWADKGISPLTNKVVTDPALQKLVQDGVRKMAAIDKKNRARLTEVVKKHGWPGTSLVGADGASSPGRGVSPNGSIWPPSISTPPVASSSSARKAPSAPCIWAV